MTAMLKDYELILLINARNGSNEVSGVTANTCRLMVHQPGVDTYQHCMISAAGHIYSLESSMVLISPRSGLSDLLSPGVGPVRLA